MPTPRRTPDTDPEPPPFDAPPDVLPRRSPYLTMDDDLVGREVCFVQNARNLLAATVIRERDRIPDVWGRPQKRLDLQVERKHESTDKQPDLATGGFRTVVTRTYRPDTLAQVRYSDPCTLDINGHPTTVPFSMSNIVPGTWFFADRYTFRVDAVRYERKPEVNRRSQMNGQHQEIPNTGEPAVEHHYDTAGLTEAIREVDRLYAMGEGGQCWWDAVELSFVEKGGL